MDAEHIWEHPHHAVGPVTHPGEFWRRLFGSKYPAPEKRFLRPPATEPWFEHVHGEIRADGTPGHPGRPDASRRQTRAERPGSSRRPARQDRTAARRVHTPGPPVGPATGPAPPARPAAGPPRRADPRPRAARAAPAFSPEPAPAEPGASLWTGIFGPAAATVSVPLTFG